MMLLEENGITGPTMSHASDTSPDLALAVLPTCGAGAPTKSLSKAKATSKVKMGGVANVIVDSSAELARRESVDGRPLVQLT